MANETNDTGAASGDRDAAVDLLLNEIRGLKQLLSQHSGLEVALSDTRAKLAGTESELKEVGCRASCLEEQLRVAKEDLSAAKLAAAKHQDEFLQLKASVKNRQARLLRLVSANNDLERKIKFLEEQLKVSKQKQIDKDENFCKREAELSTITQELRSELATEKKKTLELSTEKKKTPEPATEEKKTLNIFGRTMGAAIRALPLVGGAIVYLRLSERR